MNKDVVILGGGISGLSLAWYLRKFHGDTLRVTLLEKSDHLGGWFTTLKKDGFVFDTGPHYIFTTEGQDIFDLIEELHLKKEMILSNLKSNVSRIYKQGKIVEIPKKFKKMIFSPLTTGLFKGMIHDWVTPKQENEDESIHDFINRRFSKVLADGFGEAYVAGVISGDIHKLSMRAYLPHILFLEKEYGSVVKGLMKKKVAPGPLSEEMKEIKKHAAVNFYNGLSTLTNALGKSLESLIIRKGVKKIDFLGNKANLELEDGQIIEADHVFSTIPSFSLADIISDPKDSIKAQLKDFYYKSMAVVSLGYKKSLLTLDGYGYVIPFSEHQPVIGTLFDSSVFPQMNRQKEETRLTVMIGDEHLPKEFNQITEDEFKQIALKEVKEKLHIDCSPDLIHVTLVKKGIPKFFVGHHTKVEKAIKELKQIAPNMTVLGSGFYGAAISRCIANSKKTAKEFKIN